MDIDFAQLFIARRRIWQSWQRPEQAATAEER
jgi:hypothetical protein